MASEEKSSSGISIQTLVISALAAVAAAVIVPLIWERGTLIATAMTPVIVALVSEALRKPAEKITAANPLATRRSATGAAVRDPHFDPLPPDEPTEPVREDDPFGLRSEPRSRVTHHWKLALATGAAAFAIAVVALTASELVLGGPATREGGRTTFIRERDRENPTPTATPEATAAPTETAEPTATSTPSPEATETATPTATPAPPAPAAEPEPTATATP